MFKRPTDHLNCRERGMRTVLAARHWKSLGSIGTSVAMVTLLAVALCGVPVPSASQSSAVKPGRRIIFDEGHNNVHGASTTYRAFADVLRSVLRSPQSRIGSVPRLSREETFSSS